MKMFFSNIVDDILTLIKISMKVYFIENLKINILIKTNVFISHEFLLNYAFQFKSTIINNY